MSAAFAIVPTSAKRIASRETSALVAREVDGLVSRLLAEIKVPYSSLGTKMMNQLLDLKKVLSADYMEVSALPSKPLAKELSKVVDTDIKRHLPEFSKLKLEDFANPQWREHLNKLFGPRELELRAERYLKGAGLSLRGFFCRADLGERSKFVIFVNTAHHPGAVAATLGHELGHYIYGSMVGEKGEMTAFMEGAFATHLTEDDELFADSLVALAAYPQDLIKKVGAISSVKLGSSDDLFNRIKFAYDMIGPRYDLDLSKGKLPPAWRVRYLTSMAHFFKLRCALYKSAGI